MLSAIKGFWCAIVSRTVSIDWPSVTAVNRRAPLTLCLAMVLLISVAFASQEAPSLAGTWRLVEFTNYRDGKPVRPFGDEPIGYFFYTEGGYLSIQILKNPSPASLDEFRVDFRNQPSYVGYFGRYHVDWKRSVVVHQVEGGTVLDYIGTDQERPFALDGDRLVIGVEGRWERVLERAR